MARVTTAFTDAAKRSLRIGFDAIELHFAHGYLLHSFVSPLSNKRNDAYGGSFEDRMRFPLEVVRSVRAAVPRAMPLGARITGTEWLEGGLNGDDAVAMAKALKQEGFDYIDISSGNITPDSRWPTGPAAVRKARERSRPSSRWPWLSWCPPAGPVRPAPLRPAPPRQMPRLGLCCRCIYQRHR